MVDTSMGEIITRKDHTSISCSRSSDHHSNRKAKVVELTVAIFLIVVGTYFMILAH